MNKSFYGSSMWEGSNLKLSILVPTRDTVYTHFAYCLTQLYNTTRESGIDTYLFFDSSTILLNQRERLLEKAKEVKSDYVLWLDSDMMFPSTTAIRLLNHNKDIVACNYMKRTNEKKTVAYKNLGDWNSWLRMDVKNNLEEVEGVGMGCMLMKTDVFENIRKPYFEFTYKEDTQDFFGEDFNLQKKLRDLGYKILIDTLLSVDIKHIGTFAF
jgi:glycosyltransferase involved in cell wall biosynthesis